MCYTNFMEFSKLSDREIKGVITIPAKQTEEIFQLDGVKRRLARIQEDIKELKEREAKLLGILAEFQKLGISGDER
jgi:hypothetical protein